jgi:hypothetical protein
MVAKRWLFLAILPGWGAFGLAAPPAATAALTPQQQACVSQAKRLERAGWTYLHVQGEARDRGFQHGYLLANEIAEGLRMTRVSWEHETTMEWSWLTKRAAAMFTPKIDPEILAELDGLAEGARAAGIAVSRDDLLAYNGILELQGYWWPLELKRLKDAPLGPGARQSCSSFIATGSSTKGGGVVLGHNTMQGYADAWPSVIEDILPAKGHRILWQTTAGWIHSGTDFFITDAGLVGSETTIGGFDGFDTNGIPEFARMRRATQDASSLDQWADLMRRGNNGGYANAWLLGDVHSGEIARLELGLKFVAYEKKRDGYFIGSNVAEDRKILKFETDANDLDIRLSSVARRVRWKQLMKQYAGRIDLGLAQRFEADHFDASRGKPWPGGHSLCGHFERDPLPDAHGVPYDCNGTVDGKVVDAALAKKMSFLARWGTACGRPFLANRFLAAHPQFEWLTPILKDRPSQPWALFQAGE